MEDLWLAWLSIFIAGITGIWKGIPVGFALHAHPFAIAGFTALGSTAVVLFLVLSGDKVKNWIMNRYSDQKMTRSREKFSRIMDKYGVAGIGLIGCGLVGPIVSTIVGLILVQKTRRLILYLIIGVVLWSSLLTAVGEAGIRMLQEYTEFSFLSFFPG